MCSRLERLIRLAQKTGDTLIVHDSAGRDMVVLDADKYEMMHDMNDMYFDDEKSQLHEMNEREMLDKINRDIAIWRSHQEQDERSLRDRTLEDTMRNEPPFDPFEVDYAHAEDWHKAGQVLESKHRKFSDEVKVEDIPFGMDDEDDLHFDFDDDSDDEMSYDALGEENFFSPFEQSSEKKSIPFVKHDEQSLQEEKIDDDEPVFFEEPI